MALPAIAVLIAVALFAIFPLTDTDIWWHLACAREWVTTWTPVRSPVVNVHDFYQQTVYFIYGWGGAPALVAFKAIAWVAVFALFGKRPFFSAGRSLAQAAFAIVLLFIFRYHLEIRPVLFSLLFLGVLWNLVPCIEGMWGKQNKTNVQKLGLAAVVLAVFALQWVWCKCQGLYILGPVFVMAYGIAKIRGSAGKRLILPLGVLMLFVPFLHRDGLELFFYPFGLLDRLLGLSQSAVIFSRGIAENRSPVTLLFAGENVLQSLLMITVSFAIVACSLVKMVRERSLLWPLPWIILMALLTLVAERNFVLLFPLLVATIMPEVNVLDRMAKVSIRLMPTISVILCGCIFGLWCRSILHYDKTMVSYQRVPVHAVEWMRTHPHQGRLFNDDRAGGYLAFMNPGDSIYVDGRFILKTADFFEQYLRYGEQPSLFLKDADSLGIDRVVLPIRYFARWEKLYGALMVSSDWSTGYVDNYYVVLDRKNIR